MNLLTKHLTDKRFKIKKWYIKYKYSAYYVSLIVQENVDPDVQKDLINYFNKLVPMDEKLYIHSSEGRDDMPAHIKSH